MHSLRTVQTFGNAEPDRALWTERPGELRCAVRHRHEPKTQAAQVVQEPDFRPARQARNPTTRCRRARRHQQRVLLGCVQQHADAAVDCLFATGPRSTASDSLAAARPRIIGPSAGSGQDPGNWYPRF